MVAPRSRQEVVEKNQGISDVYVVVLDGSKTPVGNRQTPGWMMVGEYGKVVEDEGGRIVPDLETAPGRWKMMQQRGRYGDGK